jgi:uncharacterized protein
MLKSKLIMNKTKIFPSGIATGAAFCNRETERKYLKECFANNEHIVIVAPRRYGKTSLITQAIQESNILSVAIDLLLAVDAMFVLEAILLGVGEICSLILEKETSLKDRMFSIFSAFNPKLTLSAFGQKLELSAKSHHPNTITEALLLLEKIAKESDTQIVFAMDEFQQIATISNNHTIEASIRHAVERSENVTYIFSGSNRNLLEQMFNDKTRPLYHLCELLRLDRIKAISFKSFIEKLSEKKWASMIDNDCLELIMTLTEQHTFYVNRLCRLLWKNEQKPSFETIKRTWENYVHSEQWIAEDISKLTANQRNIMKALAKQPTVEIYGEYIRKSTNIPGSSIEKTVLSLKKMDMIYCDNDGFHRVLDPAIRYFLLTKTYLVHQVK